MAAAADGAHVQLVSRVAGGPLGITEGAPGIFYFTTGDWFPETAFSVTTQGAKTALGKVDADFQGPLISGANNRFYSSTSYEGHPSNVVSFGSAAGSQRTYPAPNLLPVLSGNLPDGSFLGIAGNFSSGLEYVAKVSPEGVVTTMYQFPTDESPGFNVLYASDGNYYGTYQVHEGPAVVYRLTPAGDIATLLSLPAGIFLGSPLIQASDGNLYGSGTTGSDQYTYAFLYQLTLSGDYTVLYTFPKGPTNIVDALLEGSDGNLYGAKGVYDVGNGGLFSLTKTGQYTLLAGVGPAGVCQCWLTQGSDGSLYGAASLGIFAFDAGLPKPAPLARQFTPASGAVGRKVLIWGANLLSASVEFNGVPAVDVSGSGANYVWARVPAGATSGPITVTTPGGTFTTSGYFTVR
jgi:hypothetical protein